MANTLSALKRARQTKSKTRVNTMRRTRLRHQVRAIRRLLDDKENAAASAALPRAFSAIDRAAKQGIIKRNTAAHYKSSLSRGVKALASA
jgi:small subunit ribosomal protein S20